MAALYEQGRVHHVGAFHALEDELIAFTTHGYMGDRSPDRADALIWGLTELFPRVVKSSGASGRHSGFGSHHDRPKFSNVGYADIKRKRRGYGS